MASPESQRCKLARWVLDPELLSEDDCTLLAGLVEEVLEIRRLSADGGQPANVTPLQPRRTAEPPAPVRQGQRDRP